MSTYVTKVQRLVRTIEDEKKSAQEWRLVANNRLDMLRSVVTSLQDHVDGIAQHLISLGVESHVPVGMAFVNQQLVSGEEMMITLNVIMSTIFPALNEALLSSTTVLASIDQGELSATSSSSTARPTLDLSAFNPPSADENKENPETQLTLHNEVEDGYDSDGSDSSDSSVTPKDNVEQEFAPGGDTTVSIRQKTEKAPDVFEVFNRR